MSVPSFYTICLRKVYDLLKEGTWKSCSPDPNPPFSQSPNPFSFVPSKIVDDLMGLTPRDPVSIPPRIADVFLLIKSGNLTRLHLSPFDMEKDFKLVEKIKHGACCKSFLFLEWFSNLRPNSILMKELLRSCENLEEFHSNMFPIFSVFENCRKLRVLRFFKPLGEMHDLVDSMSERTLRLLRNLEVFYVCDMDVLNLRLRGDPLAKVLLNCPQLISLGFIDSLDGLKGLYDKFSNLFSPNTNPGHLQLRRCLWGNSIVSSPDKWPLVLKYLRQTVSSYKSSYPEKVKIAVSLCPLVEELVICVLHRNAITELKNLKKLVILYISFRDCVDDYLPAFIELLQIIGPQLKKLSVNSPRRSLPVDNICELCPNLQTLNINGEASVSNSLQTNCKIFLRRLRIVHADQNSLFFILSRCKDLEVLLLYQVLCLEDDLLDRILRVNPFSYLKVLLIKNSSLSFTGYRVLFEKVISLERVCFSEKDIFYKVKSLIDELNLENVTYFDYEAFAKQEIKVFIADKLNF